MVRSVDAINTWLDGSRAYGRGANGGPRSRGVSLFNVERCEALARREAEEAARAQEAALADLRWQRRQALRALINEADVADDATFESLRAALRAAPRAEAQDMDWSDYTFDPFDD